MGIDMEIDQIMGLAKPKTAPPSQGTPEVTEADNPDFSALLNGEKPDESIVPDGMPTPELTPQISAPAFQEQAAETPTKPEATLKESPEPAAKTAPDSKDILATELPNIPVDGTLPQAAPPSEILPTAPNTAEILAAQSIAAPAQPTRAEKGAELAPVLPLTSSQRVPPEAEQSRDTKAKLPGPVAADPAPAAKAQSLPLPPGMQAIAPSEKTPEEPKASLPAPAAQMPAKIEAQPSSQPAPAIGFTNVETNTDDPAEIQFGIKIERQTIETVQINRATTPAAPVATQITAQLPQLLTKVDKQTIELRLDPPELGRVTIHLTTNDQQVTAQVIADRPDTVDLMRRHAELLTATLARAGFSQADLSFQQGQGQQQKGGFEQFQSITGTSESDEPVIPAPTRAGPDGRLDIRL